MNMDRHPPSPVPPLDPQQPPLVSIVMPAYNAARYLDASVASALAQSYPHWELLIVDDGSRDDTAQRAQAHAERDPRIRLLRQPANAGVAAARNRALAAARGRLVAFLDSDDLWMPDKLVKQVAFMTETGASVCYSAYQRIDESGSPLGTVHPPTRIDYRQLLRSNFIGNLTGIYDAARLGKESFTSFRHEDYVAWLALVKRAGQAQGIDEVLAQYRVYSGSTSSNKLRTVGWQWRIYREAEGLGWLSSVWLMLCYAVHALMKRL